MYADHVGLGVWHKVLALVCLAFSLVSTSGCKPSPVVWHFQGETMGSHYHVTVVNPPEGLAEGALGNDIATRLAFLHSTLTSFDDNSEVAHFNASPIGQWTPVSRDLFAVLAMSQQVSRESGGAFDVTVAPLIELWGFGRRNTDDQIPSDEAIAAARQQVGYSGLELDESHTSARRVRPVIINVSSLGDGYGADAVDAVLRAHGCTDYLVDVAGEMRVRGGSPRGDAWRVAIEAPDEMPGTVYKALRLADGWAVSTSGDYRNYFERDGVRYSHTIDPVTGRPIVHKLASVTVVGRDAMRADALSTALMVVGPDRGMALAKALGLNAFFIIRQDGGFVARFTPGFEQFLEQ